MNLKFVQHPPKDGTNFRFGSLASEPYIVHSETPVAALLRPLTGGGLREAIVVERIGCCGA